MKTLGAIVLGILIIGGLYAISWGIVVGMIKLITMCFGLNFNIAYATGAWLILCLIQLLFGKSSKNNA